MSRAANVLLIACSMSAVALHAQSPTNTIRNSGMCNPVITGGSGPVVIRCSGLSDQKAGQLVELMNRILSEHLDLSEVNTKLDSMGSQLSDITATLNPLAGAPVEVIKLYEQAQTLTRSCQNFALDWSTALLAKSRSGVTDRGTNLMADISARRTAVAQQHEALYRQTLLPRIAALEPDLAQAAGSRPLPDDYLATMGSHIKVASLANHVRSFATAIQMRAQRAGQPPDARLLSRAEALAKDLDTFGNEWTAAEQAAYRPNAALGPLDPLNEVNQEKSEQYKRALAPSLLAWRKQALPLVPNYTSTVDYGAVSDSQGLMRVCTDVGLIQQAYQQQQQNLMLERRAGHQR